MSDAQLAMTIAAITLATLLTRFLPFLLFPPHKKTPSIVLFLGSVLPFAIIGMLVIYCLRNVSFLDASKWIPETISLVFLVLLHRYKHNILLSIGGSTILYMVFVQYIF